MGRRAKGHTYVKYILLLDKNGQIGQRHELDSHGKLKYPLDSIPQLNSRRQNSNPTQNEQSDTKLNDNFRIPMPPMLRTKLHISSIFNMNWNFNPSPITDQEIEEPNVIDVRPNKLLEVHLS